MVFTQPSAEPLQVLVAEHRAPVAARLKGHLESLGHRVLGTARAGREAIAVAHRLDPNLVFVEAKLPGLDAIETTRAIVSERPVPVILIAEYAGADLVRRAREAGAVAHLASMDRPRLLSAIAVALERFRELEIIGTEKRYSREAPETRALVDRAKRVLMTRLGLSEAEAFQRVLDRTHGTGRPLRETAWTIIDSEEALSGLDFAGCVQLIFRSVHPTASRTSTRPLSSAGRPATAGRLDRSTGASRAL
jgi:AmiR/NasT family two-component response regulator